MAPTSKDIAATLVTRGIISRSQLADARRLHDNTGAGLEGCLVRLGYVTETQVVLVRAESLGLAFLDLAGMTVPQSVFERVPESVARENLVFPVAEAEGVLIVALADPGDNDKLEKLRFILNKEVRAVLSLREQIVEAINRHYGQSETESVDSMLAEFTDTAIDFTETDTSTGCDPDDGRPPRVFQNRLDGIGPPAPASVVERHATVRYYHRMTHDRMFPLLVVLSQKAIAEVVRRGVVQGQSRVFEVEEGSVVEVEPVLPGCSCYPPTERVPIRSGPVTATFWVLPRALGRLQQARVVVRQEGKTLAEVPLEMQVARQRLTLMMGCLSLLLPFLLMVLKHYRLDFESQVQDEFGLYARLAQWSVQSLTPEVLTGILLALTVAAYCWLRPRKRDVFWDVQLLNPTESPESGRAPVNETSPPSGRGIGEKGPVLAGARPDDDTPGALLRVADGHYATGDYQAALPLYEQALGLSRASAAHYLHASIAAHKRGDTAWALAILSQAEKALPPSEMNAVVYYNMGCFATRMGRFREAVRHLNKAVDAGYANPDKYRTDPDLEPLRWHSGFKALLVSLGQ